MTKIFFIKKKIIYGILGIVAAILLLLILLSIL